MLLLAGCKERFLELLNFLLLSGEFPLRHLDVDFQDALLACYILVHLVQLVQILLEALCLLLEFEIISRNGVLELLVGIFYLLKLKL